MEVLRKSNVELLNNLLDKEKSNELENEIFNFSKDYTEDSELNNLDEVYKHKFYDIYANLDVQLQIMKGI